jgi:hypothetical protein
MSQIKHTWHPNTFGLLYGKTTKTACSKRRATSELVKTMETTCPQCQNIIIDHMMEQQDSFNVAAHYARSQGYSSIAEWMRRIS